VSVTGPAVILVQPQLGENIGSTARAMLNCGLTELRLVAPRQGRINARAYAMASGAGAVLDNAVIHPDLPAAIGDLHWVYATTARPREMLKPVATPRQAAEEMRQRVGEGARVGILFGPERTGLESDDVALAQTIISAPLNPDFSSLNLGQAVLLVAWEWLMAGDATPPLAFDTGRTFPATRQEMIGLFDHLEAELDAAGYFANIEHKRDSMVRNLRNSFQRGPLLEQDVRTLRGVIKALANGRARTKRRPRGWRPPPSSTE
jgi:tRNA/rRNA methyltransferase